MVKNQTLPTAPKKRRTTLTLPVDLLSQAKRIAGARGVKLSDVISDALTEGLRFNTAADCTKKVLSPYRTAFTGFSEQELAILDGVILEPMPKR
jgi:hypothetical protein